MYKGVIQHAAAFEKKLTLVSVMISQSNMNIYKDQIFNSHHKGLALSIMMSS